MTEADYLGCFSVVEVAVYLPVAKGLGVAQRDRSDSGGLCLLTTNPSLWEHYEKYTQDGKNRCGGFVERPGVSEAST